MNTELHILRLLRAAGDLLTPEAKIRSDLRLGVTPPPRHSEVSEAFDRLETAGLAISVRDQLTGAVRWQATDGGRAALAARGL